MMHWPMSTEDDFRRAAAYLEPSDYTTASGVHVATCTTPLFDAYKTLLTLRTYRRAAAEKALLLLHDLDQSGEIFDLLARDLAERQWAVHTITLRGCGIGPWFSQSLLSGEHNTLSMHLQDLQAVVGAHGLVPQQMVLMGEGTGGILAQLYARGHQVAGLALLNTCSAQCWPVHSRRRWHQRKDPLPKTLREDYQQLARSGFYPLLTRHVLVLGREDHPVNRSDLLTATARDYGVEAIRIPRQSDAPSYWRAIASHLMRWATALGEPEQPPI
jgi:hypothetical protein